MDKLEQYLDQVCRSIGGPRALRQHVRQELREHLLDAVAQHQAAGLAAPEALERALAEFGKPEDVRSDLVATHGQRVMAVVIEKAMQWKEKTMKAKWLWMSWANLALALTIALEAMFLAFTMMFIVPKFGKLTADGLVDTATLEDQGLMWTIEFLRSLSGVLGNYTTWLLLGVAAAWGLFEWRVTSDNKPLMRLAAFGTAAVGLMFVVWLTAATLLIAFCVAAPTMSLLSRHFAMDQIAKIDMSVHALDEAAAKKDWGAMREPADKATEALSNLTKTNSAIPALAMQNNGLSTVELRAQFKTASDCLQEAQQAIREQDNGRLESALQRFRKSYGPVQEAAKKAKR